MIEQMEIDVLNCGIPKAAVDRLVRARKEVESSERIDIFEEMSLILLFLGKFDHHHM